MNEWVKVVTDPLGLAGFALFLVFGYLAKVKRSDERRWLTRVASCAAIAALVGGLAIGYVRIPKANSPPAQNKPAQSQINQVQQTSSGPGSPNVQGVQGDVTITVDQSSGQTKQQKAAPQTTEQKK